MKISKNYVTKFRNITETVHLQRFKNSCGAFELPLKDPKNEVFYSILASIGSGTNSGCMETFRRCLRNNRKIMTLPRSLSNNDKKYLYVIADYLGLKKVKIKTFVADGRPLKNVQIQSQSLFGFESDCASKMNLLFCIVRLAMTKKSKTFKTCGDIFDQMKKDIRQGIEIKDVIILSLIQKELIQYYTPSITLGDTYKGYIGSQKSRIVPLIFKSKKLFMDQFKKSFATCNLFRLQNTKTLTIYESKTFDEIVMKGTRNQIIQYLK